MNLGDSASAAHGLFDGFEQYRSAREEDYAAAMTQGMVALDTNVLLNLYRYNEQTRQDLLNILRQLGECLWVPHRAMEEFWRNRDSAILDPINSRNATIKAFAAQHEATINALRTWANRLALSDKRKGDLARQINECYSHITTQINDSIDEKSIREMRDTHNDNILKSLEDVLNGRIGAPLPKLEHDEAVQEGLRRLDKQIPPGFKDAKKDKNEAVGDYLLWEQIIREAKIRNRDVLLVTGDVKEDWWRQESGENRGPRLELVNEMRARAGVRLLMLRPESLLRYAAETLNVSVSKESVEDVERVDRARSSTSSDSWSETSIRTLINRLGYQAPVQVAVLRRAAENEGSVTREIVYEIGEYDGNRSLRGFTRPIKRIAQEMRDAGEVADSRDVLEAVYDGSIQLGNASGFRIPQDLVPLVRQAFAQPEEEPDISEKTDH